MAEAVPEKVLEITRRKIPLGDLGEPDDIADAICFITLSFYAKPTN